MRESIRRVYMYLCDHGRVGAVLRMERGRGICTFRRDCVVCVHICVGALCCVWCECVGALVVWNVGVYIGFVDLYYYCV